MHRPLVAAAAALLRLATLANRPAVEAADASAVLLHQRRCRAATAEEASACCCQKSVEALPPAAHAVARLRRPLCRLRMIPVAAELRAVGEAPAAESVRVAGCGPNRAADAPLAAAVDAG